MQEGNEKNKRGMLSRGLALSFKTDNHVLSIVSRANGMNGWIVRNFIPMEANIVLKI